MAGKDDYLQIFKLADKNNDGILTYDELLEQMKKFGYTGNDEMFKTIFATADNTKKKALLPEEFLLAMKKAPEIVHKVALLRRIFTDLDVNKDGYLTRDIIGKALMKMGQQFTKTDLDNLMNIIDTNKNQQIELEEFIRAFMNFKGL